MDAASLVTLSLLLLLLVGVIWAVGFWPGLRRRRIVEAPMPDAWKAILRRRMPWYEALPSPLQERLEAHIKLFLADKRFVGCAGQSMNDEIRLTIAGQACLLVLNRPLPPFPDLRSILVYPSAFIVRHEQPDEFGLVSQEHTTLLGESWSNGRVILAWDNVQKGVFNLHDGINVVLHEFAHQLDSESGRTNGAPLLRHGNYQTWAEVFQREFEALQHDARHGHSSLLDFYGATNPAEFFAVATETFFERAREMAQRHPALYEQLAEFYQLDPTSWS